jgi:hypothetical protein
VGTTLAARAAGVLCARDTSLCPRTVLGTRQAARQTCASEGQARGRRSTRAPWTMLAGGPGAGGRVSAHGGRRARALAAQRRSEPPACTPERGGSGSSHRGPVRRPAPFRRALSRARMWPAPQRAWACPEQRRPAPLEARRGARPCLAAVVWPRGSGMAARLEAPGGRSRPRRRTPTGEAPSRWGCRRSPRVARQRLWHPCRGDTRRRTPAPAGRGPGEGWRRATRGAGSAPCRAPWAAASGAGRPGAAPW